MYTKDDKLQAMDQPLGKGKGKNDITEKYNDQIRILKFPSTLQVQANF